MNRRRSLVAGLLGLVPFALSAWSWARRSAASATSSSTSASSVAVARRSASSEPQEYHLKPQGEVVRQRSTAAARAFWHKDGGVDVPRRRPSWPPPAPRRRLRPHPLLGADHFKFMIAATRARGPRRPAPSSLWPSQKPARGASCAFARAASMASRSSPSQTFLERG